MLKTDPVHAPSSVRDAPLAAGLHLSLPAAYARNSQAKQSSGGCDLPRSCQLCMQLSRKSRRASLSSAKAPAGKSGVYSTQMLCPCPFNWAVGRQTGRCCSNDRESADQVSHCNTFWGMTYLNLPCFLVSVCHCLCRSALCGICIAVIGTAVGRGRDRGVGNSSAVAARGYALGDWRHVRRQATQRCVYTKKSRRSETRSAGQNFTHRRDFLPTLASRMLTHSRDSVWDHKHQPSAGG